MNISVIGWYDHNNIGDEAYKLAIPTIFSENKLTFSEVLEDRDDIDLVLLGGGDIVSSSFINEMKKTNKKKIAASVTIHPGSSLTDLNIFDNVSVRDIRSLDVAKKYLEADKLNYVPDFTFALVANQYRGRKIIKDRFEAENHKLLDKVIVVNINSYLSHIHLNSERKGFTCFLKLAQDIAETLDQFEASVLFIPFGTRPPDDDRVTNAFVNACSQKQSRNVVIYDRKNVMETLDIIAGADLVIASRLHCSIFSTIAGVPFIDITHHDKNLGFLETIGKKNWSVPFWNFNRDRLKELIDIHLSQDSSEELKNITAEARIQLLNFRDRIERDYLPVH